MLRGRWGEACWFGCFVVMEMGGCGVGEKETREGVRVHIRYREERR